MHATMLPAVILDRCGCSTAESEFVVLSDALFFIQNIHTGIACGKHASAVRRYGALVTGSLSVGVGEVSGVFAPSPSAFFCFSAASRASRSAISFCFILL